MSRFSRGRAASPQINDDDDNNNDNNHLFTTATETSFKDLLHSTPQRGSNGLPLHYDQHPSPLRPEYLQDHDQDTLGSAEMSIELGRGVKRSQQQDFVDMSSNAIFSFDHHTPPLQARSNHRNGDAGLRKQASLRRATASARANDALNRNSNRAVSDTLPRRNAENEPAQATGTFSLRGSRFAGVRQVSSQYNVPKRYTVENGLEGGSQSPRRTAAANATVQSATFTAGQSFMLPDLPNITELVSGRNEGTPLVKRTTTSRTRFVSGTHRAVNALTVPQDEQAIFASLQVLGDRVAQLELEKSEAQRHVEEYEHEVIELRAQLGGQRPDSGLGSEDDDSIQLARSDKTRLQAKIKAAEERLQRTERKASVSEITVARITKERDHLVQQLASAYVANQELENENKSFRDSVDDALAENDDLKARVRELEEMISDLRSKLNLSVRSREPSRLRGESRRRSENDSQNIDIAEGLTINNTINAKRETWNTADPRSRRGSSQLNNTAKQELSSKVQREMRKQREAALAMAEDEQSAGAESRRSRSKSQTPTQRAESKVFTGHAHAAAHRGGHRKFDTAANQPHRSSGYAQKFEDDLTQLTDLDPVDVANLRRKLEEEMRTRHGKNHTRAQNEADLTSGSATQHSTARKSSMRDVTAGTNDGTAQFDVTKTVRVQSPHTADEISHSGHDIVGDISTLSNTSRRRRRSTTSEGLTSAFILPDITVAVNQVTMPVPITERSTYNPDSTDVTLRPSQTPALALATVIKHLEDEIAQLKRSCDVENKAYTSHDPAMAKRSRLACLARLDALRKQIEKRSDQVYALYDVLEAHKDDVRQDEQAAAAADQQDDADDSELGFEGFSEIGDSEDESREVRI
ncbi:Putative cep57 centrosome microtubule-binding domain-containing protein [Septoria linicola]|uniref:Cep57 centrosome microtubule-binding domain-containing protein n=1 Tax=Septoria linicola TaxID=215465 RepID=A0A9Q9ALK1_9PEZI|nr:Putative cep57 centrosome microtubule-binding domain-containing protein [Septoria linicola]